MQDPKVDKAIQCVLEKGWVIQEQLTISFYQSDDGYCCPMGAVYVCDKLDKGEQIDGSLDVDSFHIAPLIEKSTEWVAGFMQGFDEEEFPFSLAWMHFPDFFLGRIYGLEYRARFLRGEFALPRA